MSQKIETMGDFIVGAKTLRQDFPQFALEIDRMIFDVGQNHLDCCGKPDCECGMPFELFHDLQNVTFNTEKNNADN